MALLEANMDAIMKNRELTETRMIKAVWDAESRAEEERSAHNATKMAAQEREVELEHRALEASKALAGTQRIADERTAKASELEQKMALLEVECANLNQELQDMQKLNSNAHAFKQFEDSFNAKHEAQFQTLGQKFEKLFNSKREAHYQTLCQQDVQLNSDAHAVQLRDIQERMTKIEKAVEQKLNSDAHAVQLRDIQERMTKIEKAVEQKLNSDAHAVQLMAKIKDIADCFPRTPVTPSGILRAVSSSETKDTVDHNTAYLSYVHRMERLQGKPKLLEGDARILDMLSNSDVSNLVVEGKALGYAGCAEIDEFGTQRELQHSVSENLKRFFCSQTSELTIQMPRNFCETSSESVMTKEAGHGDGASMFEPLAQPHSVEKHHEQYAKIYGSATATTMSQLQTPNAKSRKQEWKDTRASGLCSPSPDGLNSIKSNNKTSGCSIPLSGEADVHQIIQDWMNQLMTLVRGFADTLEPSTQPTHEIMQYVMNKLIKRFEVIAEMFKKPTLPITPVKPSEILRDVNIS